MLGVPAGALKQLNVKASRSGSHAGRLLAYSQHDGASFVPTKAFIPGETVTVHGRIVLGATVTPFALRFTVARADPLLHAAAARASQARPGAVQSFRSRPDLRPPAIAVSTNSPSAAPGYIFAAPYAGPSQDGPLIFDDGGNVVWFHPLSGGTEAADLQVQQYRGRPVLTWWQGYIAEQGFGQGQDVIAGRTYTQSYVRAGNGYAADLHDFQIGSNGTALLTIFNPISCNLSALGGPRDGAVTDGVFQEIDLSTGLVRREWHSLDHVALASSYSRARGTSTKWPFDYFHINSLQAGPGGTVLLSARNTWALYELDGQGGQIVATVGGRQSSFKMGAGTATAWQHDARLLPDGTVSVFDNGAVPRIHSQSRGVVLALDAGADTVSVARQYLHPSPLLSGSQGNFQTLANGDVFIGWGDKPYFSEFSSAGALLFDARMASGEQSYRGFRFAWIGTPASRPYAAATTAAGGALTVYASWNGATNVAAWRVLAGPTSRGLTPVATAAKGGFETAIATQSRGPYLAVQALDGAGAVLATSKVIRG
jgi:hypothetical protein